MAVNKTSVISFKFQFLGSKQIPLCQSLGRKKDNANYSGRQKNKNTLSGAD